MGKKQATADVGTAVTGPLGTILRAIERLKDLDADPGTKATALYRIATYAAGCGTDVLGAALSAPGVSAHGGDPAID